MKVHVESQSLFHPHQFDRYLVEFGKAETRWTVMGHPELTVEVTQDIDGNLIIRVM